jgi:predicted glycosyltransferase
MSAPRVMVYVQHLLGIGHQMRAAAIVRAMQARGPAVVCVSGGESGGMPDLGGARLVQLPPVRAADAGFGSLVDAQGREIDDAWREGRKAALLDAFREIDPDVLLIESFPFGRWQFRFELMPLLAAARASGVAVASSVRDILVEKNKPGRPAAIVGILRDSFDLVLVHGDEGLVPFGATFPAADAIANMIRYTGYVAPPAPDAAADGPGRGEVVVAAGGGAVGGALLRTALAARPLSVLAEAPWRLITGPNLPPADREKLAVTQGVTVETLRADYRELLSRAALSVSQAGYNTVMDILVTGVPAVLVPFAAPGETEQTLRARLLAERGRVELVEEAALSPESLARAIDRALARPAKALDGLALDGAAETARIVEAMVGERGGA